LQVMLFEAAADVSPRVSVEGVPVGGQDGGE
jgi:hypothetical protein